MRHERFPKWFRATSVATVLVVLFTLLPAAQPARAAPSITDKVLEVVEDTGVMDLIEQAQKILDQAGKYLTLEQLYKELVEAPDSMKKAADALLDLADVPIDFVEDLAKMGGEALIKGLKAIEGLERVEAPLPGGYLIATRKGEQIAFCVYLNGPGDSAATLGLANDDPLCQEGLPRLANPSGSTVAFLDLTRDGSGHRMLKKSLIGEGPGLPRSSRRKTSSRCRAVRCSASAWAQAMTPPSASAPRSGCWAPSTTWSRATPASRPGSPLPSRRTNCSACWTA